MGLDFIDVGLRVEKHFGTKLRADDWRSLVGDGRPPDIAVGALFDFIQSKRICRSCRNDLRGHPEGEGVPNAAMRSS